MKLSEAIRLGAMLGPQTYGPSGLCAGNSALAAISADYSGANESGGTYGALSKAWPFLRNPGTCPVCNHSASLEFIVVFCLNDDHEWTREQIADWVETIEQQQDTQPQAGRDAAMEPAVAPAASAAQETLVTARQV